MGYRQAPIGNLTVGRWDIGHTGNEGKCPTVEVNLAYVRKCVPVSALLSKIYMLIR